MSVIDEVRKDREDLARVLKKHTGIRKIVEDLYPDSAHFIYELLQNAEDTGATEASFKLTKSSLVFEHNGRPFEQRDIYAITDIGEGTKAEDDDKIGRFGVGFKAVFAYTETPHIWSPTFSFKITDLVLPHPLTSFSGLNGKTRFEFPFNNPKKGLADACKEVADGLEELAETTLLFLTHLESISWQIDKSEIGEVLRINHSTDHVEVLKQKGGKTTTSLHFLKFEQPVSGLEKQKLSIAYALDFLPNVSKFDAKKPINKQLKIISADPGKVAVFFPAEKETSGLRFHLHAPFVPELSRASIKETPANTPLFNQLGKLAAKSLHKIKKHGLLTSDFLGVLPNPHDTIPARYSCIRSNIVKEMNEEPLTPTYSKSHAPARNLLQARAIMKSLLSEADLDTLVDYEDIPPKWAVGAIKGSNAERFLDGLEIQQWDLDEFYEMLCNKAHDYGDDDDVPYNLTCENFQNWLSEKSVEWHQQFYSVLFEYIQLSEEWDQDDIAEKLGQLNIVLLNSGEHWTGCSCYYPSETAESADGFHRVDANVFSAGKSKSQQEKAKKLLDQIGVKEVGEYELIQTILNNHYLSDNIKPRKQDIKRFVTFFETEPDKAKLFSKYYIFECENGDWAQPQQVYIDLPLFDTGLRAYFNSIKSKDIYPISENYRNGAISFKRFIKFFEAVGGHTKLKVSTTHCHNNPQSSYLYGVGGERYTSPINRDYIIEGLDKLLKSPTLQISKLIWNTMCYLPHNFLLATFRRNETWGSRQADSQLVHELRKWAWIPQGNNNFVKANVASRDLLPDGFPFDSGWHWLKAINFGEEHVKKAEEKRQQQELAKKSGFNDLESYERAKKFASLPPEEQLRFLEEIDRRANNELPENEPSNPSRRAERVGEQAAAAPERTTEERIRSVSVGREVVKQEAAQYLRQQYTNKDGEMICQICKQPVPFKLDDGSDYFEKVEFIDDLTKRHYQNYLALCPNHSAMFKLVNGSKELMKDMFVDLTTNELEVILAQSDHTIYFTKTHIADLKSVINSEDNSEASD